MNWRVADPRRFSGVRMLTFDLDDTLWPCFPTIHAAEREVHAWLAQTAPVLVEHYDIDSLREHRMQVARANPEIAHDLTEIRLRAYRELAERHGLPSDLARQANRIFRRARNRVRPYEEVIDALRALRRRYVLVAVSNGNAQIDKTPLAGCFEHAFMAEEVGAAKPDPALFRAASQATGIPLSEAAHVGDDPERDVLAARRAGLRSIWVDREGRTWPPELAPPDLRVAHLGELRRVLMEEVN
jgi:putative hydrolase of the HAD superfamily